MASENQRVNASNAVQADSTDFMFKGTYKMGNNSLTLGYAKDDSDTTGDNDVTSVELIHNFSSRAATVTMKPFLRYGVSLKELDIAVV
jgi:hypothetical protein